MGDHDRYAVLGAETDFVADGTADRKGIDMEESTDRPPLSDEDVLVSVIQTGVLAADMWHLDNQPWLGTQSDYTRGLINTAIRHVVEQGLLRLTDDVEQRLSGWLPVQRDESRRS